MARLGQPRFFPDGMPVLFGALGGAIVGVGQWLAVHPRTRWVIVWIGGSMLAGFLGTYAALPLILAGAMTPLLLAGVGGLMALLTSGVPLSLSPGPVRVMVPHPRQRPRRTYAWLLGLLGLLLGGALAVSSPARAWVSDIVAALTPGPKPQLTAAQLKSPDCNYTYIEPLLREQERELHFPIRLPAFTAELGCPEIDLDADMRGGGLPSFQVEYGGWFNLDLEASWFSTLGGFFRSRLGTPEVVPIGGRAGLLWPRVCSFGSIDNCEYYGQHVFWNGGGVGLSIQTYIDITTDKLIALAASTR